ncbi:MAG TPA: cation diffusion facilitator family transporter [Thermoanaerobaculia bacterium]
MAGKRELIEPHQGDKHHTHGADDHGAHPHAVAEGHGHSHGSVDASILTSERGIAAVRWSFVVLFFTALIQIYVYYQSRSVGLLADTIHNFSDAATAVPLWIAFTLSRSRPSNRFPYGLGRVEDLAGVTIVFVILFSAVAAGYESIHRFLHPVTVGHLYAVMFASVVGFLGNEAAAIIRIRAGKKIESAALIADGHHARVDGLASLAVLFGALGVKLGYPLADPIVGILITLIICKVVWDSVISIFTRMLDGVDPALIPQLTDIARKTEGVAEVGEVRARWLGHRLMAEVTFGVAANLTVEKGHEIAKHVQSNIQDALPHVAAVAVHVDPSGELGEEHHHRHT